MPTTALLRRGPAAAFRAALLVGSALAVVQGASVAVHAATLDLAGTNKTLPQAGSFGGLAYVNGADALTNNGAAAAALSEGGGASGTVYAGAITDGASPTGVTHTGGSVLLTGANSFSGGLTVAGGTVIAGANQTLGGPANSVTVTGSGALGTGATLQQLLTLQVAGAGTVAVNNGGSLAAGSIGLTAATATLLVSPGGQVSGPLTNAGNVGSASLWNGDVVANSGNIGNGAFWNGNVTLNSGNIGNVGQWTGNLVQNKGNIGNNGVWTGSIANGATGVIATGDGSVVTGAVTNAGQILAFGGAFNGPVANSGIVALPGPGSFDLTPFGPVIVAAAGSSLTGNGKVAVAGGFTNLAGATLSIASPASLAVTALDNAGLIDTAGTLTVATPLVLNPDGTPASGGLRNSGTVNATGGQIGGGIVNTGTFAVTGTLASTGSFVNQTNGVLSVMGAGHYTIASDLFNSGGTVTVGQGASLSDALFNGSGGLVSNSGTYNADVGNAATIENTATGAWNGTLDNGAGGLVVNDGTWTGAVTNAGRVSGAGVFGSDFVNAAGGVLAPTGATTTIAGTLTNAGTIDLRTGGTTANALTGAAYVGQAGSAALVNVDLASNIGPGASPTGGQANRLVFTSTTGTTALNFTNVAPGNAIAYYPSIGIVSVANNPDTTFVPDSSLDALKSGIVSYSYAGGSLIGHLDPGAVNAVGGQVASVVTTLNSDFFQDWQPFITAPQDPDPNSISGGPWIRGKYGVETVDATVRAGPDAAKSRVGSDYAGFQVGGDVGLFNIDKTGWNVIGGVTAGEVFINSRDKFAVGTRGTFEIPFVGVYGALTNGPFHADVLYRHDFYGLKLNDTTAGLVDRHLDADGDSLNFDAGYQFALGKYAGLGDFFVEPNGSFILSRVKIDSLSYGAVGVERFGDVDSDLGRLGFRFGMSTVVDKLALQPFVTASVWHEFAGNANAVFETPGPFEVPVSVTRVGTFGQFGLGLNGELLGANLLGTIRADFRTGDKVDGQSVTAQLRYQF